MNNQGQVRAGLAIIGPAACALALTLSIRPYAPPSAHPAALRAADQPDHADV